MKVTLKDISEKTGFSVSTVSRVLRGKASIREKNKQAIIKCAREMGYLKGKKQSSSRSTDDQFIALITQFHEGEFYASFFQGFVETTTQNRELNMSLYNIEPNNRKIIDLLHSLMTRGYDAAVLFVPELKTNDYKRILEELDENFPVVSCSNISNPVMDTVTFDAYRGAALVADHFSKRSYRSFGLITGPHDQPEARFRTNGFKDFVEQQDQMKLEWMYTGDYSIQSGKEAYADFASSKEKPRAIFAANDASALGFMEAALSDGLEFPKDVAIAGYDNLPICEYHYPNLTSVDTDFEHLAEVTLTKIINGLKKPLQHKGLVTMVPVSLIVRDSS